jgi:hypothetical protein
LASLASDVEQNAALNTAIAVDGPYGEVAMSHWQTDYAHLIFCGGGSGVSPLMPMLCELLNLHAQRRLMHVQSVHLIWVASNVDPIRDWFPNVLRALHRAGAPFELHLHDTNSRRVNDLEFQNKASLRDNGKAPLLLNEMGDDRDRNRSSVASFGSINSLKFNSLPGGAAPGTPMDDISRLPIMTGIVHSAVSIPIQFVFLFFLDASTLPFTRSLWFPCLCAQAVRSSTTTSCRCRVGSSRATMSACTRAAPPR